MPDLCAIKEEPKGQFSVPGVAARWAATITVRLTMSGQSRERFWAVSYAWLLSYEPKSDFGRRRTFQAEVVTCHFGRNQAPKTSLLSTNARKLWIAHLRFRKANLAHRERFTEDWVEPSSKACFGRSFWGPTAIYFRPSGIDWVKADLWLKPTSRPKTAFQLP
jgi:hypothetical protein